MPSQVSETNEVCIKCGNYAPRHCTSCGYLCIEHTCSHLRDLEASMHLVDIVEELPQAEFIDSPDFDSGAIDERSFVTTQLKHFLSDEVTIGSMDIAQLRRSLERYKSLVRLIEDELSFRSIDNRTIRRTFVPNNGVNRSRMPRSGRKNKEKSPIERLIEAIRKGILTKEVAEAILLKVK